MTIPPPVCSDKCKKNRKFYAESVNWGDENVEIIIVTELPIAARQSQFGIVSGMLFKYMDYRKTMWCSLVKCQDGGSSAKKFCAQFVTKEIEQYKPKLVITYGPTKKDKWQGFLPASVGFKKLTDKVHQTAFGTHTCSHIHVYDIKSCFEHPDLSADNHWNLGKVADILNGGFPKRPPCDKYYFISNVNELTWAMQRYNTANVVAFDIEAGGVDPERHYTVGLDPWRPYSYVIGASIAAWPGEACFIDFTLLDEDVIKSFLHWLGTKKIAAQNGKFDLNYMKVKYGVDLYDSFFFDTMLADHVIRAHDKRHSLKFLAARWLPDFEGYDDEITTWFKLHKIQQAHRDYGRLPRNLLFAYGCMDADVTLQLTYLFHEQLNEIGLTDFKLEHVMDMQESYAEMEYFGWGFNHDHWLKLKQDKTDEAKALLLILHEHELWKRLVYRNEADLRAKGQVFYHDGLQMVFTDSQCLEEAPSVIAVAKGRRKSFRRDDGTRVKANTYTMSDIIPDASNDNVKRRILFGKEFMDLKPVRFTDKSTEANMVPQVSADALREVEEKVKDPKRKEIINTLIKLEKISKLMSTYITPVFDHVDKQGKSKKGWLKHDGLIHPTYMLAGADFGYTSKEGGTRSGRISAMNPNMTNQPTRGGGHVVKKIFVPVPRDFDGTIITDTEPWVFIQLDYSQLELRILAALSREPLMFDAYLNDEDLHKKLACELFHKTEAWFDERLKNADHPEHKTAFNLRLAAKTGWFSVIYGSGPGNIVDTMREQGLKMTWKAATDLIDSMKGKLPQVAKYRRQLVTNTNRSTNMYGRFRIVNDINSNNFKVQMSAERILFNNKIQSSGSDAASKGINLVSKWLRHERREKRLRSYPCGGVHDSNIIASPTSEVAFVAPRGKRLMESIPLPSNFGLHMKVDVEVGPNWGELAPLEC